jgi:hypothetical protein
MDRFTTFYGLTRCPLHASVETVRCYLGYLFRKGRITGTSTRLYLAATHTVHVRAGLTSLTHDPIITFLRAGFKCATTDRFASRPRSMALPAALGALAFRQALQAPWPTPVTAIAVGFFLALSPMSIRGLYQDDINLTRSAVFFRLRSEKGNTDQCTDRVLRVPVLPSSDPVLALYTRLKQFGRRRLLFPYTADRLNRAVPRFSHHGTVQPRRSAASPSGLFAVAASRMLTPSGYPSPT